MNLSGVTATLNLDQNGTFTEVATGTLENGTVTLKVPQLSGPGTYEFDAEVSDKAGNIGTSAVATVVVDSVTTAPALSAQVLTSDVNCAGPNCGRSFSQVNAVGIPAS
jgi:hypothetical protein